MTSRWTMPCACAWARPSSTCAAASSAAASSSSPARIASRSVRPGDVLVDDVDVAARRARARARAGSAGAGAGRPAAASRSAREPAVALARDDLERDLAAGLDLAREPDRARAAAAERPHRQVAVQDQAARRSTAAAVRDIHTDQFGADRRNSSARRTTALPPRTSTTVDPGLAGPGQHERVRLRHRVRLLRRRGDGREPASVERPRSQRPPGGPPPRPPGSRGGIPPTARLVGLIAFGILIIVLLVLWVQSCSGTRARSRRTRTTSARCRVARRRLEAARPHARRRRSTTPGIKAVELANKIDSLAAAAADRRQARRAAQGAVRAPRPAREHARGARVPRRRAAPARRRAARATGGSTNAAGAALAARDPGPAARRERRGLGGPVPRRRARADAQRGRDGRRRSRSRASSRTRSRQPGASGRPCSSG